MKAEIRPSFVHGTVEAAPSKSHAHKPCSSSSVSRCSLMISVV